MLWKYSALATLIFIVTINLFAGVFAVLRGAQMVAGQATNKQELVATLQQLLVVVESYPQLKADQHYLALQTELINTENRIQAARRFYNGNIRDFRNKCETFPSNLIAQLFGFKPQDYFNVPPTMKEVPDVQF